NRDKKLAEMAKKLLDAKSRKNFEPERLPKILEDSAINQELSEAGDIIKKSMSKYNTALEKVIEKIKTWRGDDPITQLYNSVFEPGKIVELDEPREKVFEEFLHRTRMKIPPGYKDAGKDDGGIGDFLIWKTILQIGSTRKCNLIFVTGDEKADWFIRAGGNGLYPRPELIDEYRRYSGGASIRFLKLHELLEEMNALEDVISDVKSAEDDLRLRNEKAEKLAGAKKFNADDVGEILGFDYSQNNGRLLVIEETGTFEVKFSKAGKERIYLLRSSGSKAISRLKSYARGQIINLEDIDMSSDHYAIGLGEGFLIESTDGHFMIGRIYKIEDDTRGDRRDWVEFEFKVYLPFEDIIAV
ncbi:PIN-like domain-containing protein, partial [Roseomonas mucosa]